MLYAHHKSLDYFSTECVYSPEAFRGSARALIKSLERIRPSSILDIVKSGEDIALLVPGASNGNGPACNGEGHGPPVDADGDPGIGGCGSSNGRTSGGEMAAMEQQLQQNETADDMQLETEVTLPKPDLTNGANGIRKNGSVTKGPAQTKGKATRQKLGQCSRCGYLTSQAVCKACMLLEGLNKNRPKTVIAIDVDEEERSGSSSLRKQIESVHLDEGVA